MKSLLVMDFAREGEANDRIAYFSEKEKRGANFWEAECRAVGSAQMKDKSRGTPFGVPLLL